MGVVLVLLLSLVTSVAVILAWDVWAVLDISGVLTFMATLDALFFFAEVSAVDLVAAILVALDVLAFMATLDALFFLEVSA